MARQKLSAVVISYNRADVIETTLRAARFADQLVVVDKSSTDGTAEIGRRYADVFLSIPWSPTVEGDRAAAMSHCTNPWILSLDDDECLNGAAIKFILGELENPRADIYQIPFRHYILGRHDERAYYWPEYRPALFRAGTINFTPTVHQGIKVASKNIYRLPDDDAASILHLSHRSISIWLEKTNRYTSQADRKDMFGAAAPVPTKAEIERLMAAYLDIEWDDPDGYLTAVGTLRALYNVIDYLKRWEARQMPADGFLATTKALRAEYAALKRAGLKPASRPKIRRSLWERIVGRLRRVLPARRVRGTNS